MRQCDVVVIGSGTAGQTAAHELKTNGSKVVLVENSERPGGTCALYGCQPKKWFYEAAEIIARSRHLMGKGIVVPAQGNWQAVRDQKNEFTSTVSAGTVKGLQKAGIEYLRGTARFSGPDTLEVDGKPLTFKFAVIATGSKPISLPLRGSEHVMTSNDFFELNDLPEHIVFIGGGYISFELSHFAVRLGPRRIRATILETNDRPLAPFDAEMVSLLTEASSAENIDIRTKVMVTSIDRHESGFQVNTESDRIDEAGLVVHGAGRAADIDALALPDAGVETTDQGIWVDRHMRTSNPAIFSAGDCAATTQLARVADYEALVAAKNILVELNSGSRTTIDYGAVPALLFTYPQYGMVGKTEDALLEEGIAYRKNSSKKIGWPTYRRVGLSHAGFKVLAGDDGRILGAHIVSDSASGLINTFRTAMVQHMSVEDLYRQNIMSPYPSRESDIIYMLKPLL